VLIPKLKYQEKPMKQKCIICSTAKAKRGCLLKNMTLICPRCCAEIRNSACEGCSYYKDSQKFAVEKTQKAQKAPKRFVARMDPEVDDEIDRALMMAHSGNIAAAEKVLRALRKKNVDLYSIHFAMGTVHAYKEEYKEAMTCFDKSLDIFPYFVDCWFNRALCAQKQMDILELVVSLRNVIEFGDPADKIVTQAKQLLGDFERTTYEDTGLVLENYIDSLKLFNTAFELMQNRQWEKAIAGFKEAIKINPTPPQSFGNIGLCYAHLNENELAIEAFDKAIALDPDYEPAIINKKIFEETIAKGQKFSETQAETNVIKYMKDYSVKDKFLAQDYLDGKMSKDVPHTTLLQKFKNFIHF